MRRTSARKSDGELVAGLSDGARGLQASQGAGRLSCGYLFLGVAPRDQVAQYRMQTADDLGAQAAQVPAALGPQLEHGGMVLGGDRAQVLGAKSGNGHGTGVVGVVLIDVAGGQQPHARAQFGLHVQHSFARRDQLLGQQVAEATGTFDGPGPLGPLGRPRQQPLDLVGRRAHPQLAERSLLVIDRHGRVRGLVGVDTDYYCHTQPLFSTGKLGPRRACLITVTALAPLLSHTTGETRRAGTSL